MAAAVARAMEARSHLLVEAGTGVGKSFAYLVPAMLRCLLQGETVVIATNTIALQEQLVGKDIPLLQAIVEEAVGDAAFVGEDGERRTLKPILVKGRGNYVSVRRLKLASDRQERLLPDPAARRSLHVIEDWAYTTPDGTLSTLPPLERYGVWDKVQSDSANCMGRRCPTYAQCFFQKARRELEGANLLVCNHALFFSDLALRSQEVGFLPRYDHVVLDEAHNAEDVASDHFGVSLTENRVNHFLSTLHHPRTHKGYLNGLELAVGDIDALDRAVALVAQAQAATRSFFESLLCLTDEAAPPNHFGSRGRSAFGANTPANAREGRSVRIRRAGAVTNVLTPAMRELSLRLKALKEAAKSEPDRFELNAYAVRAELVAVEAETLVSQTFPRYAYWVETSGRDDADGVGTGQQRITFACSPVEVGPLLKERLFNQPYSVVLTSATLATRTVAEGETREGGETAFAHAMSRLGCEGAHALQLGSPFDYKAQAELYIDATPARPGASAMRHLADRVLHHIQETDGGAFVLFTSFSALNAVASELAGPLAELGYPLLAQGRDGSRTLILQRFRESENSVLLGAASFWQGVDVRGSALRNVIITKLPFDPPDRPLTQARTELIEERGGDAFRDDTLPRAVIKFKQGVGRLIRSKTDTGRIVLLDARVLTARYGRTFLRALPEGLMPKVLGLPRG